MNHNLKCEISECCQYAESILVLDATSLQELIAQGVFVLHNSLKKIPEYSIQYATFWNKTFKIVMLLFIQSALRSHLYENKLS